MIFYIIVIYLVLFYKFGHLEYILNINYLKFLSLSIIIILKKKIKLKLINSNKYYIRRNNAFFINLIKILFFHEFKINYVILSRIYLINRI